MSPRKWMNPVLSLSLSLALAALVLHEPTVLAQDALHVHIDHLKGFSAQSEKKVAQTTQLMEQILNGEEFRQAVLNFTYQDQKQFANNEGLSNEEIYEKIMAGKETYDSLEDGVANLDLNLYTPPFYKKWSVVGYGYPDQPQIYLNSYYFNSYSLAEVAANLSNEWMHKIGFEHDYINTAQRPYSVPYGIGSLVLKLGKKSLK
jgi:hypothetical protein